jgi:hypothetical protein
MSAVLLVSCFGCTAGVYEVAPNPVEQSASGYCHKKLRPVGSSDPARITQNGSNDYIDYSGPCDGPSMAEQIRAQRRFEQFRFGRDYMDEG